MSAVPLWAHLRSIGKTCILGNLTFINCGRLDPATTPKFNDNPCLFEISRLSEWAGMYQNDYAPEKFFCEFLHDQGEDSDFKMYSFFASPNAANPFTHNSIDVAQLQSCYEDLIQHYEIDAIVVCDGGTDSLMRGDEFKLGTVHEDMTSIAAVYRAQGVPMENKFLLSLGFGVDYFHGCEGCHALENISHLIRTTEGGYLGCFSLIKEAPEYAFWKESFEFIMRKMDFVSIVGSSIIAATDGQFGNYHSTQRTSGSELFINPLMSIYFCFSIEKLAGQILFIQKIIRGECDDVGEELMEVRGEIKRKRELRPIFKYPH